MKADADLGMRHFMAGGGEMGELMRSKDWSLTPLGPISEWPQNLKNTLNIILNSRFPMFLFWGPELLCFYNDAYRPSLGNNGKHPAILGQKAEDYWQEIWDIIKPLIDQVMNSGEATWHEDQLIPIYRNGTIEDVYWTFSYSPVYSESGNSSGVFVTCTETTEKVINQEKITNEIAKHIEAQYALNEAKQKLDDAETRLRLTVDATHLAIWDLDLNNRHIIYSPKLPLIFGHPESTVLSHQDLRNQIHREDIHTRVENAFDVALETGAYHYEARVIKPDQSICWIQTRGKVIYDAAGKPARLLGTVMDITEQKQSEEKFAKLAAIVQSSDDAIISKTLDGIIISWNTGAERIFGYTETEMIGQPILKLIPADRLDEEPAILSRLKVGERVDHFETKRLTKDKKIIDVSLTISPLKDSNGRIIGVSKIARDITLQKNAERIISENEERLQVVIAASDLGTWEINLKTGEVDYSERYLEIVDYTAGAKLTQADIQKNLHPDDTETWKKAFSSAFENGHLSYEVRIVWKDESIHWVEGKGKVLYDTEGNPYKLTGTLRDTTNERLYQQKIEDSEKRLRTAALSSELGTWDYNPTTETLRWDNASRELFGVDPEIPVTVELFWSKMHPDDREQALNKMLRALDPNIRETYDTEYRITGLPDEKTRWIHAKGKAFFDKNRKPYLFSGTVLDVTEKRIALEELQESEQKFRMLADSMPQLVWTGDELGNLNYFNTSVYNYTGLSPEQIVSEGWLQIVHPEDRAENITRWMYSVSTGEPFLLEHRFLKNDGTYRWQLSRAAPQKDATGNIQMWVGTSTDIHEQKTFSQELENQVQQRTSELKRSNEELIKSNSELAQFAYVASHDLQEPLRKIQTFITRILDWENENLSDKGRDYFFRIQSASKRMQQLILDLLSFSRASTSEKHFEAVDLNRILQTVKDQLKDSIDSTNATIKHAKLPVIHVISYQFEQLFTNLLSNALKFAKKGVPPKIEITHALVNGKTISHPLAKSDKKYHCITISDNGIGFDPQFRERIFNVFQRLHGRDEYAGTGIGLSIVKKIIENHSGFIEADSSPDIGTTFKFYIPAI
jgi:PAS domain S-box-containing protein